MENITGTTVVARFSRDDNTSSSGLRCETDLHSRSTLLLSLCRSCSLWIQACNWSSVEEAGYSPSDQKCSCLNTFTATLGHFDSASRNERRTLKVGNPSADFISFLMAFKVREEDSIACTTWKVSTMECRCRTSTLDWHHLKPLCHILHHRGFQIFLANIRRIEIQKIMSQKNMNILL